MIPLRDQEVLRQRFERDLPSRVRIDYFTQKQTSIFIPGRDDCPLCAECQDLMEEVSSLSDRVNLTVHDLAEARQQAAELGVDRVPAIVIRGQANRPVRFFGLPSGGQFPGFVETLIDSSQGTTTLLPDTQKRLRKLKSAVKLQVFVTPTCAFSPAAARTAFKLGLQHGRIKVDVVEISEFPALVQRYNVRATPTTVLDEKVVIPGLLDETALVRQIFRVVEGRPISANELRIGPATAFALPQQEQQRRPRPIGSSGLVLPG